MLKLGPADRSPDDVAFSDVVKWALNEAAAQPTDSAIEEFCRSI